MTWKGNLRARQITLKPKTQAKPVNVRCQNTDLEIYLSEVRTHPIYFLKTHCQNFLLYMTHHSILLTTEGLNQVEAFSPCLVSRFTLKTTPQVTHNFRFIRILSCINGSLRNIS